MAKFSALIAFCGEEWSSHQEPEMFYATYYDDDNGAADDDDEDDDHDSDDDAVDKKESMVYECTKYLVYENVIIE